MDKKWYRGVITLGRNAIHRREYTCKLWTTFKQSTVFDAAANACTAHIILKNTCILKAAVIIDSRSYSLSVSNQKTQSICIKYTCLNCTCYPKM